MNTGLKPVTSRKILFICWSERPIHGTLIQAAFEALRSLQWRCSYAGTAASAPSPPMETSESLTITSPLRLSLALLNQGRETLDAIFFQSVHPANVLIGLWARLNRIPIVYYLHEPTGLSEKLKKGDSPIYAVFVWITQYLETKLANSILVATDPLIEQAIRCFPRAEAPITTLPLAIPNLVSTSTGVPTHPRNRVLYLGRAHSMRCLDEFLELANYLEGYGSNFRVTILTYNEMELSSPYIDIRAGKTYSDQEMLELLDESIVVWNVYNVDYSQSGVTPVALRSGVPLLVSSFEKEKKLLSFRAAFEIQIDPFDPQSVANQIEYINTCFNSISTNCINSYNSIYSPIALVRHFQAISIFRNN